MPKLGIFWMVFALVLTCGCQQTGKTEKIEPLGAMALREQDDLLTSVKMLKIEAQYNYAHRRLVDKAHISGEPFGFMPWNIGEAGAGEFYIEIGDIGKANCYDLAKPFEDSKVVLVNGEKNGICKDSNIIRWIFAK